MRMSHILFGTALASGLVLASQGPALAQMGPMSPGTQGFQPMVKPDSTSGPKADVPPALPGATPGRGAAPADKSMADLAPNDALFDAINRGDISQARDAVNRGADLGAQNVLGMTPLELSIDLSRNDITFLLLSLRGATSTKAVASKDAPALITRSPTKTASAKPASVKLVAMKDKPPSPGARQYAGPSDPGTPDPSVGFLGFGHSVQ